MQVEINEQNIVKYNLVQLTGNTTEELMTAAAEAEANGYVLSCRIPDVDELLEHNVFESVNGDPVSPEDLEPDEAIIMGMGAFIDTVSHTENDE